jgi:hypothetical protein
MNFCSSSPRNALLHYCAPRGGQIDSLDGFVQVLVDAMLGWGVAASIAYWFVLLFRLPAWSWYPFVAINLGLFIYFFRPRLRKAIWADSKGCVVALLLIALLSASINVFTNVPDADDIAFSHRAVVAAYDLSRPLAMTDTVHDVAGLPPISPLHVFTSLEVTTALVALALGLPQVFSIHMLLGTLTNFMFPAVYFLLLRSFRVRQSIAVFGVLATLLFLLMCGDVHRDLGEFTVLRSWQGKCILVELMLPLALLYCLRFLFQGSRSDAARLHAVMCCGMGLSGTGLFLVPYVVVIAGLSAFFVTKLSRSSTCRFGIASTVLLQPAVVSTFPRFGILPKVGDISVWLNGWPVNVFDNLELVFSPHSVFLYFAFFVAAILVVRGVEFFALLVYTVIATGLLLAPGTGSLLMHIVTPAAFWRFAYALLVPLWVGLAISGLLERVRRPYVLGISCAISAVVLVVLTFVVKTSAIGRDVIARPGLKFSREDLTQVYEISRLIKGRAVVLGPPDVVIPLALLRPDMRFIATRSDETLVVFANAGLKEEGSLRGSVSEAIASCDMSSIPNVRSEQHWPDMNVVVFPNQCDEERVRTLFALGENWKDVPLASYQLLVRTNK